MDGDGCPLFADDGDASLLSEALKTACDDVDSRGTFDAAAPKITWEHAGTTVTVIQQATFSDTAALVWMEPIIVARWLADHCGALALGRTLDLGAGTGFLGVWAKLHGLASKMAIADRPSRINYLRQNIALNQLSPPEGSTCAIGLPWGDLDAATVLRGCYDTVLAVGLIYDPNLHVPLVTTIAALAAPRVLLAFARRHQAREESFLRRLGTHYKCTLALATPEPLRGNDVFIYECELLLPPEASPSRGKAVIDVADSSLRGGRIGGEAGCTSGGPVLSSEGGISS